MINFVMWNEQYTIKELHRTNFNKLCNIYNIPFEIDGESAMDISEEELFLSLWDVHMFIEEEKHNTQLYKMLVNKMHTTIS